MLMNSPESYPTAPLSGPGNILPGQALRTSFCIQPLPAGGGRPTHMEYGFTEIQLAYNKLYILKVYDR